MLWGIELNHGENYLIENLKPFGEILRISEVSLDGMGEGSVYIEAQGHSFLLARVRNSCRIRKISLFFDISQGNVLTFSGQAKVRLLGYIEPYVRSRDIVNDLDSSSDEIIPPHKLNQDSSSEELVVFKKTA